MALAVTKSDQVCPVNESKTGVTSAFVTLALSDFDFVSGEEISPRVHFSVRLPFR